MSWLALLVGRFHALTRAQGELLARLGDDPQIAQLVVVVTSADHAGTRRNPLDAATREAILRPALDATRKPYTLVRVADIPDDAAWVAHVVRAVEARGVRVDPSHTRLYTANREVDGLFARAGFHVDSPTTPALTPHELVQQIVDGKPWLNDAAPSTRAIYEQPALLEKLRTIFGDRRRTDDGELGAKRDFESYGNQMDAALVQKLEDLLPFVLPGKIVDKGCGTGKLLVELSRRFPESALVGVDLSREFLRRTDENTYAGQDVELIRGDAALNHVPDGSASTVIFSSIMHEIYTYSGYDQSQVERALASAARELRPGGHVLIRDGVSPDPATWRLRLLDEQTRATFVRFASEFKHGQGAAYNRISDEEVRISSHLCNEFLCKKDYLKNWHIEIHEEYGARTVDGWRAALERHGYDVLHLRAYVSPWIAEHRYANTVALTDDAGAPLGWPATNVVAVGVRR